MSIELTILISCISLAFAVYTGITNMKRGHKTDVKSDTAELTTVIVKLENIGNGISEIKKEMSGVKGETRENRERIIKVEESVKQAHKHIDELQSKIYEKAN